MTALEIIRNKRNALELDLAKLKIQVETFREKNSLHNLVKDKTNVKEQVAAFANILNVQPEFSNLQARVIGVKLGVQLLKELEDEISGSQSN